MKWFLIWYITVTLPNGNVIDSSESRRLMASESNCRAAIKMKQTELEAQLGTRKYASYGTIAPTGGYGTVSKVSVGCIER